MGPMIVLWVPAYGSITFTFILLWTRLMVGFVGLSTEPSLLLLVLTGFLTWELSISFECSSLLIRRSLMITLVSFSGIGNFSSGITLLHNINLFHWYLSLFRVGTTYDLGVLSPDVDINVAGGHRVMLDALCSHTGCWSRSGGSSLAWASCQAYSCFLGRLLHCCRGLWWLLG